MTYNKHLKLLYKKQLMAIDIVIAYLILVTYQLSDFNITL